MDQMRGRVAVLVVLAVVAVSTGGLIGRLSHQGPPTTVSVEAGSPPPTRTSMKVHVSGMVVAPGVVDVAPDAIVADAIDAAGGLRSEAMVDQINLAAPVAAGDQIVVPGAEDARGVTADAGEASDGILSLSRASAGELESLPGVGPVLAERIVAFRAENGGFETVEDLLQVSGIGEAKLAAIRDLVRP